MENKEQKALDRVFWATVGAVAAVILFAALLLGFSLPGVHRFHGIMGFDGYYRDNHTLHHLRKTKSMHLLQAI